MRFRSKRPFAQYSFAGRARRPSYRCAHLPLYIIIALEQAKPLAVVSRQMPSALSKRRSTTLRSPAQYFSRGMPGAFRLPSGRSSRRASKEHGPRPGPVELDDGRLSKLAGAYNRHRATRQSPALSRFRGTHRRPSRTVATSMSTYDDDAPTAAAVSLDLATEPSAPPLSS